MSDYCCNQSNDRRKSSRKCGILGTLIQIVFLYVLLVFGGGTLINTGHPVAMEVGRIIHTVTLVEPSIHWARSSDHHVLAGGLEALASGIDLERMI